MKGLSSYICSNIKEVEREIERGMNATEVPYLEDDYRNWMSEKDDKKPSVVYAYVSYLRSADINLFTYEDDFFELLKRAFIQRKFDEIPIMFDKYIGIINEWFEDSKKEDVGIRTKPLSDWRSGYKNYRKFIEYRIAQLKEQDKNASITEKKAETVAPKSAKDLFMSVRFAEWLENNGLKSASSYISYIKNINREFFCKLQPERTDLLALIPKYLQKQPELLIEILLDLEGLLNEEIKKYAKDAPKYLTNGRSAFRQYIKFIREIAEDVILETSNFTETEDRKMDEEENEVVHHASKTGYEKEDLKLIFNLRLLTQDRISKNKDLFFPIRLISRIFHLSERMARKNNSAQENHNGAWIDLWTDECVEKITIHTDKGDFRFTDITLLEIQPDNRQVTVTLDNGETAVMLTETKDRGKVTLESKALRYIHIDHTPLMAELLKENFDQLPALQKITAIIRNAAGPKRIHITASNISKINSAVLQNTEFTELEALIPQLKDDLTLIREKASLCLMSQAENLKKK